MAPFTSTTSQSTASRRFGVPAHREDGIAAPALQHRAPRRREPAAQHATADGIDEGSIGRSVRAVERAVANITALQENRDHYRDLAIELRRAFDDEKEHAKVFAQQLADADRARRADRERADRAERRLEQAARTIDELEQQLAAMRARADRLAHSYDRLTSGGAGRDARAIGDDLASLLAA